MIKAPAEPMNTRAAQVASTIRRAVQERLARGLNDPRIRGLISVTKVQVSDDLVDARVFVSILPEEAQTLTMHGLRHAAGHLQGQIAHLLRMRRAPRLTFHLDESLKRLARVDAVLAHVREELSESDARRGGPLEGPDNTQSSQHPTPGAGDAQQGVGS
jgi:ribosome-binding factor A